MFRHYFKTAWRNLKANKFYSILNISGLAVGLATGIMLLLWVENEFGYDKFNKDADNIYRVNYSFKISDGDRTYGANSPAPLKPFAAEIRNIEDVVRIHYCYSVSYVSYQSKKLFDMNDKAYYVDDNFFKTLSFPLLYGNESKPFTQLSSVVISETLAKNIFGMKNVVGKVLNVNDTDHYLISGVMKDMPHNTSVGKADILFPMSVWAKIFGGNGNWKTIDEDLGSYQYETFVRIKNGANADEIAKQLTGVYDSHRDDKAKGLVKFNLQSLKSIHLIKPDGNRSALHILQIILWVAVLILLIASINYINLSTARSLIRMKEVSIKKIIGASKLQLFFQFIAETLLLFCIAFFLSIVLLIALMPLYNDITGEALSINITDLQFWKIILLVIGGTLIVSGIYPAVLLSSFKPISSLKGKAIRNIGTSFFRQALVVVQFVVSVIIIIATIVMGKQMRYIKTKDLGYDKSYVFMVNMPDNMLRHSDAVINELKNEKSVISVATASSNISNIGNSSGDMKVPGQPNLMLMFHETDIDKDLIPTMKMQFASGHNFTGMPSDSTSFIINETAAKAIGMKNDAVGKTVTYHGLQGTIIGVLKDFNFENLKENIKPVIIGCGAWWYRNYVLYVRTTAGNAHDAINAVEKQYKKYVSDIPFSYDFLDKSFEAQYKSERRTGTLFNAFATIAIFISCLGLFGLATYTAQVKTKEIGIRKVLGASVGSIVKLISKDFLKLVVIAIVIATPLAYWAMNKWLSNFAYKTSIGVFTFIVAALVVVLIAFGTIGFKALKAARANPVRSLKTE